MKIIGYLLITVGFLAGALSATVDAVETDKVHWIYFAIGLAVAVAGVVLVRLEKRSHRTSQGKLASNMEAVKSSMESIAANVAKLDAEKGQIETYEMRHRIDEALPEHIETFVEARESIAHVHGLQVYADVMSSFAAGERYLNRVWSASADGYIDEVNEYIGRAKEQFEDSVSRLRRL